MVPRREPASQAVPYDLASLTKPLATALLALLLEQEGLLELQAPVEDHLGELSGTAFAKTTLTDLAAHRAGLAAWRPLYLSACGLEEFLQEIARVPPAVAPGETLYSDLGFIVLGAVVERAAGDRLDRLFDRRIVGPLGLRATGFPGHGHSLAGAAPTEQGNAYERRMAGEAGRGHSWRTHLLRGEVHDANAHALGGVTGHSGLFGTAEGVAEIAREILRPRLLTLSEPNRQRLLRRVPGSESRTFGLVTAGHSPSARDALPPEAPGHTGFTGTSLWFEPERGGFFILLSNRVHPKVQKRGLQPVRNEFHRIAASLLPP